MEGCKRVGFFVKIVQKWVNVLTLGTKTPRMLRSAPEVLFFLILSTSSRLPLSVIPLFLSPDLLEKIYTQKTRKTYNIPLQIEV